MHLLQLKSIRIHFAPGNNGRRIFIEIPSKLKGCGTRHTPNRRKDVEGGVCRPSHTCVIHVPLLPAQSINQASSKGTAAA